MKKKLIPILFGVAISVFVCLVLQTSIVKGNNNPVTVTATVNQTVTCNTNINSTALGVLTSNAISSTTGSNNASSSLTCNDGLGCTLSIQDQGDGVNPGLATTTAP